MVQLKEESLPRTMHMSQDDIGHRKRLLSLTGADEDMIAACQPSILSAMEAIVDQFYVSQISHPEIALLFGDADHSDAALQAVRTYLRDLFSGSYGPEYVEKRLSLGAVQKTYNITPAMCFGAMQALQSLLHDTLRGAADQNAKSTQVDDTARAVSRLMMFDLSIITDAYIVNVLSDLDRERQDVEHYAESLEETIAEQALQLAELARKDILTNLYNQRAFYEHLRREASNAERHGQPLCLLNLDVNRFKAFNDREGHIAGDTLLASIGRALQDGVREGDIACRYGGDQFCIILPKAAISDAQVLCDRLVQALERGDTRNVAFSIGIAQMGPDQFFDVDHFVKQVDGLVHAAKIESGKRPGTHVKSQRAFGPH